MKRRASREAAEDRGDSDNNELFFVVENPSSQTTTLTNRIAIRSQIAKNRWRQAKLGRGGSDDKTARQSISQRRSSDGGKSPQQRHSQRSQTGGDSENLEGDNGYGGTDLTIRTSLLRWEGADQRHTPQTQRQEDNFNARPASGDSMPDDPQELPSPLTFLGPGSHDPFKTYPSTLEPSSVAKLTQHCKSEARMFASPPEVLVLK
jgi:hypothetical protein